MKETALGYYLISNHSLILSYALYIHLSNSYQLMMHDSDKEI
jgi:hypothetical protein